MDYQRFRDALRGRYTVEREIGRGGMAIVFLADDVKHGRQVAIKILRPEFATAIGPDRFLREIAVAAQLHHPHILPLYDSGEAAGFLYYVMPFVEGESLRDRLEREKQLPLEDALRITREVADALSYAHGRGILHRDIKPENILLASGHALVADFGIARAITAAETERLTETGLVVGTPSYMSPEQGAGERDLDGRTDLYSLACVTYEMLAGAPPYVGPTAQAILARRMTDPVPPIRTVRDTVSSAVEQAIVRALAKVPADRFSSVAAYAAALATAGTSTAAAEPRHRSPRRWLGAALALLGAGALVAVGARAGRLPVAPAAQVIAVLPPSAAADDTALTRLSRNLVVTVSANLNGVGKLRAIDALTVLAQTQGKAEYTLDAAAAFGRRLGASGVVFGTATRDGDNVRLDVGLYGSADAKPVARAFVTAPLQDVDALTDSVTWSLLREVWRAGTPPSPSLGAITTRSMPALRAFLDGEQAIVDNRWEDAATDFDRAVHADSTFWLAHFRHAYATSWQMQGKDSVSRELAQRHAADLPEPERLLLHAWDAGGTAALDSARLLTERYPDYWPGWLERADRLSHVGPLFGYPIDDARRYFGRALALNPTLPEAWQHLAAIACTQHDALLLDSAGRALGGNPAAAPELLRMRMLADVFRGQPFAGARADSVVALTLTTRSSEDGAGSGTWLSRCGYPGAQIAFSRRVMRGGPLKETADGHRMGLAVAWAARGAWDSAMTAIDTWAALSGDSTAAFQPYRFAVLGAWLGALDPAVARARRAAIRIERSPADLQAFVLWMDGLLAVSQNDSVGLATARRALGPPDTSYAGNFARALAAYQDALRGHRRAAAESLYAMAYNPRDRRGPTFMGVNHLIAATWLAADGAGDRALLLLYWHQAIGLPEPTFTVWLTEPVFAGVSYLEAARIEEARGDIDAARRDYGEFLLRWDAPDTKAQHIVDDARSAFNHLVEIPFRQSHIRR